MSDFYQNGVVTVLHRLGQSNIEQLEQELERYAKTTPIALVLPSLYAELERPALKRIVETLSEVRYIHEIVISLDQASALEFRLAKQFFSQLPQRVRVVWNDGTRIQAILNTLVSHEIDIGHQGKGRGCWTAYGYVLARGQSQVIALHDCDIVSYDSQYLARLCYPVANPNLAYEFCKGYYSRVTDRMHGRVTRLFITPLIRSLQLLVGPHPLLSFLDSFRYAGLLKMCVDITKSLFRNLASEGLVLSESTLKTLRATYLQAAQEAISRYENDAAINSLRFDRHEERRAVEVFLRGMMLATDSFLEDPLGVPMISNWSRVTHAVPDIFHRLMDAVEQDHAWDPAAETRQPVS